MLHLIRHPLRLAALTLLLATPVQAQGLSPAVGNALRDATALAKKGQSSAAIAKLTTARNAASTPFEKRKLCEVSGYVYYSSGNYRKAAQEMGTQGCAGPGELAGLYYKAGDYTQAISNAKRGGGPQMPLIIAQSYVKLRQYEPAILAYKKLIARSPSTDHYQQLASLYFKTGKKTEYMDTLGTLITRDPSPANWRALLLNLKGERMEPSARLAFLELLAETGNLTDAADIEEYAKLAILSGAPGSASRVLAALQANGRLPDDDRNRRLLEAARSRSQQAIAGLASADPASAGRIEMGLGRFDRAAAQLRKAPKTPENLVNLGIAQVRSGQAGAARKTLQAVPASSFMADLAQLWALYAKTKG